VLIWHDPLTRQQTVTGLKEDFRMLFPKLHWRTYFCLLLSPSPSSFFFFLFFSLSSPHLTVPAVPVRSARIRQRIAGWDTETSRKFRGVAINPRVFLESPPLFPPFFFFFFPFRPQFNRYAAGVEEETIAKKWKLRQTTRKV